MYSEQYSAAPSGSGPKQRGKKSMMVSLMTILFMRRRGLTVRKTVVLLPPKMKGFIVKTCQNR
jgi:hypothetical protein